MAVAGLVLTSIPPAFADEECIRCGGSFGGGSIIIGGKIVVPGNPGGPGTPGEPGNPGGPGTDPVGATPNPQPVPFRYFSAPACVENNPRTGENGVLCSLALTSCPEGEGLVRYWFWRQGLDVDGQPVQPWERYAEQCLDQAPVADEPLSEVTPDLVLAAFRELPLPAATARVQPEGPTLVNVETIFYTDAAEQTFDITLLGQPVAVTATPVEYTWHTGDGTTLGPTTSPGAPYPDHDVAHIYLDSEPYQASVDVTYGGEFSVDGGPTIPIPGTVTIAGPQVAVEVLEARAQLVANP
jgi:hypothetical protein